MTRRPPFLSTEPLHGLPYTRRTRTDVLSLEAGLHLAAGRGAALKVDELLSHLMDRGVFDGWRS